MNEGKKDRRDPIRTVKPRNFVAKNASATTSGAGAHKDKKKAAKQGETKHKKAEYAEHLNQSLKTKMSEGYGKYWCSTDKKWKQRQGPKQTRTSEGMSDEFTSPEYNDEAGMAQGSLYTLKRAVDGLMSTIDKNDNLPEWCQEKISLAEDYLVTVWDYIQSEKAQGIDPKVSEASALEKFRKGSAEREKKHADIEASRKSAVAQGKTDVKGAVDRLEKSLSTKESWSRDALADQLFEHERTYEEQLANKLKQKLGK